MQPLKAGFRWYGDNDEVPLEFIAQSGAKSVFTSLHQIPYGEVWSVEDIAARQEKVASYGLEWDTVESVPVSEILSAILRTTNRLYAIWRRAA